MARRKKKSKIGNIDKLKITLIVFLLLSVITFYEKDILAFINKYFFPTPSYAISEVPEYRGFDYVIINNNEPNFTEEDLTTTTFEKYSDLDLLDRCGVAYANVSLSTMPKEERGSISNIKPTGWHLVKYDIVDGKYLYNRCHLIGYQLTGENVNPKNLITCTRQMNTGAMLDFENKVANYVKETQNHVLYRVIPIFKEDNLLASGVEMEAMSVEDKGAGLKFHVFVYNVEEGIIIDYKTGDSKLKE